jgi:hypothetical protein
MRSTDGSLMPFYSLPLTKESTIFYSSAYINEDNKTANGILYSVAHRFYQAILYTENVIWFHGTHTHTHTHIYIYNLIHAHHKSKAFPVPVFMELINAQTHYVQISDTDLHPNWTTDAESRDRNSCMPLHMTLIVLIFMTRTCGKD